jgi:hypothetical protein
MRLLRAPVVILCSLGGCGPVAEGGDAHVPGEYLGAYAVDATLEQSTCGAGALNAPNLWQFEVRLSQYESSLYWLNGAEAIHGRLAADGSTFSFETKVRVEVQPSKPGFAGCTIFRLDRAKGKLEHGADDVAGFSGEIGFGYAPEAGSDCGGVVGVAGGFATLPCELSYTMQAERLPDPR